MRQRSPGSWELRAYGGVDALTGKVRYRTRTVRASKSEAAKALRELVASAQAGPAFGAQASFATLLEAWIAAKEPGWSKSTLRETKSIVGHHVRPRLGGVPVGAITTAQIDQMLAELGRSSLSSATVGRIRGVVHAALAQAVRWDWIWSNPAANATRIDVGPRCHVVPDPAVVTKVLESLRRTDPMLMMFVRLAATTGARRGEILGLSWADIDLAHGRVRLVRGLIDAAGGPVLQDRKTKNANCVDLDAETVALLRTHREQCSKRAAARGVPVAGCPLFSTADVMTSWKPNWVTRRFAVALDQAGVEHFRLHDLRHFVATQLLASGVGLPVVSARLRRSFARCCDTVEAGDPTWAASSFTECSPCSNAHRIRNRVGSANVFTWPQSSRTEHPTEEDYLRIHAVTVSTCLRIQPVDDLIDACELRSELRDRPCGARLRRWASMATVCSLER